MGRGALALAARCPPRLCADFLVFTRDGSSLGFVLLDLPRPPRPAVDFILDIRLGESVLGGEDGDRGSSLIGARSKAASSSPSISTNGSDINLHKRLDRICIRERLDQLSVPYFPRAAYKQVKVYEQIDGQIKTRR